MTNISGVCCHQPFLAVIPWRPTSRKTWVTWGEPQHQRLQKRFISHLQAAIIAEWNQCDKMYALVDGLIECGRIFGWNHSCSQKSTIFWLATFFSEFTLTALLRVHWHIHPLMFLEEKYRNKKVWWTQKCLGTAEIGSFVFVTTLIRWQWAVLCQI